MLTIMLPPSDGLEAVELSFEHSLVSLSKWESKHEKPFFNRDGLSAEESISYIEMMLLSLPPCVDWIELLSAPQLEQIMTYIHSKQSATWFRDNQSERPSREVVTSELVYHWMITFNIPFEPCQNWHLNRLMTLIKICGIKQTKPRKMSEKQQLEEYRRLNEQRRKELGSSG